jgi:hypothetical protein
MYRKFGRKFEGTGVSDGIRRTGSEATTKKTGQTVRTPTRRKPMYRRYPGTASLLMTVNLANPNRDQPYNLLKGLPEAGLSPLSQENYYVKC